MVGDQPVKISSQEVSFRQTVTTSGVGVVSTVLDPWYVYMLPRQMLWFNQTVGAVAGSVLVEFAIRDSATAGTPEWLRWGIINLVVGGLTPVITNITTGAVWIRFTVQARDLDVVELACTAFV